MNPSLTHQITDFLNNKYTHFENNKVIEKIIELQYWEAMDSYFTNTNHQSESISNVFIQNLLFREGIKFEDCLKANNINAVRIKTFSFPDRTFPKRLGRRINDIDIWIPNKNNFEKALSLAFSLGYKIYPQTRWEAANNRYNLYRKIDSTNIYSYIDLHIELAWDLDPKFEWSTVVENNFIRLSDEDLLLHLFINWIYQDGLVGTEKILDFYFLLNNGINPNIEMVLKRAEQLKIKHSVELGISLLKELNISPKSQFKNATTSALSSKIASYLIKSDFLLSPYSHPIKFLFLKHYVRKNWTQALRYDILRFFSTFKSLFDKLSKSLRLDH